MKERIESGLQYMTMPVVASIGAVMLFALIVPGM